jgi:peptidoglycan/xylan/chitin deacetylase (PgdA/CDA1 family)
MLRVLLLCAALLFATISRAEVPILMYHKVDPTLAAGELNVHPKLFREQVRWLKDRGYTAITISQYLDHREGKIKLDLSRAIIITFDDGWRSTLSALPALDEAGFKATFFVMSGFLDDEHSVNYLNFHDAQWLSRAGHDVQSHTVSHFVTKEWTEVAMTEELGESKRKLESLLKKQVNVIAWPFGRHTPGTVEAAKKLDYRAALTITPGLNTDNTDAFHLKRINVDGRCGLDAFKRAVLLGELVAC